MSDTTETPPPVKPGYLTTEFYFSLAATLLTYLFASGALTSNTALAIAGMAATVLTALGYKVSRTLVKTAAVLALVVLGLGAASSMTACSSWRPRTAAAVAAFLECQSPHVDGKLLDDAKALAIPSVKAAIEGSHGNEAALKAALKADAAPLRGDLARCGYAAAVAAVAALSPAAAVQRLAAGGERAPDPPDPRRAFAGTRAELGWAPVRLPGGEVL